MRCSNLMECVAVRFGVLDCVAVCGSVLQHVARKTHHALSNYTARFKLKNLCPIRLEGVWEMQLVGSGKLEPSVRD